MRNNMLWIKDIRVLDILILKSIIDINGYNDTFVSQKEVITRLKNNYIQYIPNLKLSRSILSQRIRFLTQIGFVEKENSYILLLKIPKKDRNKITNLIMLIFDLTGYSG